MSRCLSLGGWHGLVLHVVWSTTLYMWETFNEPLPATVRCTHSVWVWGPAQDFPLWTGLFTGLADHAFLTKTYTQNNIHPSHTFIECVCSTLKREAVYNINKIKALWTTKITNMIHLLKSYLGWQKHTPRTTSTPPTHKMKYLTKYRHKALSEVRKKKRRKRVYLKNHRAEFLGRVNLLGNCYYGTGLASARWAVEQQMGQSIFFYEPTDCNKELPNNNKSKGSHSWLTFKPGSNSPETFKQAKLVM